MQFVDKYNHINFYPCHYRFQHGREMNQETISNSVGITNLKSSSYIRFLYSFRLSTEQYILLVVTPFVTARTETKTVNGYSAVVRWTFYMVCEI